LINGINKMKKFVMIVSVLALAACPVACVKSSSVQNSVTSSTTAVEVSTSTSTGQ